MNGVYVIYGGDVNQDGVVDGFDLNDMDLDLTIGSSGYLINDINGDGVVDGFDLNAMDENLTIGVSALKP